MRPLAILGGTFDPVHNAHLRVAWEAAERLEADVRLLPASVPPHRAQPVASPVQRVALLRAALAGQHRLALDTRELDRAGPSWSIDTLIELRAEIGADRPLVLLVGADAFAGLASWHRWRELFDHAHVGVLPRPGYTAALDPALEDETRHRRATTAAALRERPAGCVFEIDVTPLDFSASHIRALLAEGREPRYLVPEGMLADPALLMPYRKPPQR